MINSVKQFLQTSKDLINQLKFKELYFYAKQYFSFPGEMSELWQTLKSIKAPLSYSNILPGYTTYEDLNDAYIGSKDLDNLNSQFKVDLPDMTFHEILKVVRELYPASLNKTRVLMLLEKDDIPCSQVELRIASPYAGDNNYCKIQISYVQEGQEINQVITLETISKSELNWIPGLCIAYKYYEIEQQMYGNEQDILEVLKEIREGKL